MIFAGNQERGYFSEEFAGKNGLDFAYVGTYPHIADQTNDILRHGKQDYTILMLIHILMMLMRSQIRSSGYVGLIIQKQLFTHRDICWNQL